MQRYIGLDVHTTSTTMSVVSERGKQLKSLVLETNGQALVEAIRLVPGRRQLCIEEGTHSSWLYEVLSPHVEQVVVTRVERSHGPKDDARDAFAAANALRLGTAAPVFKDRGQFSRLRTLSDVYSTVTTDLVRVHNRIKGLYRSRGVPVSGRSVYSLMNRDEWLDRLPVTYRSSAQLLYAQLDALRDVKKDARTQMLDESHRHPISRLLETCPGLGPVRVALLLPIIVTPHRFRTARQLWAYSGLGVVMRSSSDWIPAEQGWVRAKVNKTRGLNRNFNRRLEYVFKGAAVAVISHRIEPLYGDYVRLTEQGTKPPLAKLTLARRIASTTLSSSHPVSEKVELVNSEGGWGGYPAYPHDDGDGCGRRCGRAHRRRRPRRGRAPHRRRGRRRRDRRGHAGDLHARPPARDDHRGGLQREQRGRPRPRQRRDRNERHHRRHGHGTRPDGLAGRQD